MCVLCNTNEEVFIPGSSSNIEEAVRVSCWNVLPRLCARACACTKGPLGEFVFLYLCLSGDFLWQTHTSSL